MPRKRRPTIAERQAEDARREAFLAPFLEHLRRPTDFLEFAAAARRGNNTEYAYLILKHGFSKYLLAAYAAGLAAAPSTPSLDPNHERAALMWAALSTRRDH